MLRRVIHAIRRLDTPVRRRAVALVVAILAGGWLGLLVGGNVTTNVGPVEATFAVRPWPTGDTQANLPPLGSVTFDTHDGPLRLEANVQRIRPRVAKHILQHPKSLTGLGDRVARDLRDSLVRLGVKAAISAMLGAGVVAFVFYRRRWQWIVASVTGAGLFLVGTGVAGYLTFNPQSIEEPRYTGLLASAPRVVGSAEHLATHFSQYRAELAKLITNVSRIYDITSGLQPYEPNPSTIRVLHVSDLHLNPTAWTVMHSAAKQFKVDVIVDSGDMVDTGIPVENRYIAEISTFDVPYVYVRGNHDSQSTKKAVAREPNSVVLNGTIKKVAGLRFFGAGDPRFTPDRTTRHTQNNQAMRAVGLQLADRLRGVTPSPDIAVIHDPAEAKGLDGIAPLLLSGHLHYRSTEMLPNGSRLMVEGSTGGSGFRGLEEEKPTPIELSVLYIDKKTKRLQAWDGIKVGGLGLSSAQITRHVVEHPDREVTAPSPSPAPPSPSLESPASQSPMSPSPGSSSPGSPSPASTSSH